MRKMHRLSKREIIVFVGSVLSVSLVIFVGICFLIAGGSILLDVRLQFTLQHYLLIFFTILLSASTYAYVYKFFHVILRRLIPFTRMGVTHDFDYFRKQILGLLDLNELTNVIVNTIHDEIEVRASNVFVLNEDNEYFCLESSCGLPIAQISKLQFSVDSPIIESIKNRDHIIFKDTLVRSLSWQEATHVSYCYTSLGALYIMPIKYEGLLVGFLSMSAKEDGRLLTRRDIKQINNLRYYIGVSLANARRFERLKKYNDMLVGQQSRVLQAAKISAIEKLAAGIAHEIHNPLTIISGKAQVLLLKKEKLVNAERVEKVLKSIVEQTKRAAEITRRLLMFAKPQSISSSRMVSVENVINDTISLVSYQISFENIKIVKVIDADIPLIEASLFELREMFLNIIMNAIQSIESSGEITITAQYNVHDDLIKCTVADTGKGIEKDIEKNIFDPFFTTRSENIGLGLFVSQQIIHRMGGHILVESAPEKGSVFVIVIPAHSKKNKNEYHQKIEHDSEIQNDTSSIKR